MLELLQTNERLPMRVLGYVLMPNHFDLVLWPRSDGEVSRWMQWLLTSHVRRYHRHYQGSGHVWQGRFKAFPIEQDEHLLTVRTRELPTTRVQPPESVLSLKGNQHDGVAQDANLRSVAGTRSAPATIQARAGFVLPPTALNFSSSGSLSLAARCFRWKIKTSE